jgi:ZIP family zinc transporter
MAAAFCDLLPESFQIGLHYYSLTTMFTLVFAGILFYLMITRWIGHRHAEHGSAQGHVGALSLVIHSLFDGVAIGLASFVPAALPVVAAAVLTHDFSDGINTVNLVFRNQGNTKRARMWLFLDAIAPIVGAVFIRFFTIPDSVIAIALMILAGFFVYIGLSDLVPESYHGHPTKWTTFSTILGAVVIFIAVKLAGI